MGPLFFPVPLILSFSRRQKGRSDWLHHIRDAYPRRERACGHPALYIPNSTKGTALRTARFDS